MKRITVILKVLGMIVGAVVLIWMLLLLARFAFCRPSYSVVKTATPMVEKIADYIVEHGVPESLEDIHDLPYVLNGCKKTIIYWNDHDIVKEIKDAEWIEIKGTCTFLNKGKTFNVNLRLTKFVNKIFDDGEIDISSDKTSVGIGFKMLDGKLIHDKASSSFDNRFGFCRQLKQ